MEKDYQFAKEMRQKYNLDKLSKFCTDKIIILLDLPYRSKVNESSLPLDSQKIRDTAKHYM